MRVLLAATVLVAVLLLSACSTLNVLGHCEVPEALTTPEQVVEIPVKITEQEAYKAWARDRASLAKSTRHHAELLTHVKEHCQ